MVKKRMQDLAGDIGTFIKKYGRKSEAGHDPNDRNYSRKLEKRVKWLKPEELDEIMNGPVEPQE